ncbi:uncharacterized protein LOC128876486 [Hylaeus volcanicus]|uniref:uncharacterized protein LOC128876486 n=1 Tax=Hylaeus volcanicus TaxID=313075 RepID=UPI0023B7EC00|nr:uncharacterized protein LOC128876486 [Hylaeus volcanicus]
MRDSLEEDEEGKGGERGVSLPRTGNTSILHESRIRLIQRSAEEIYRIRANRIEEGTAKPMRKSRGEGEDPISAPEELQSAPLTNEKVKMRRKSLEQAVENEYSDESRNARKKLKIIGNEKTNIEVNTYKSEVENNAGKDTNVRSIVESINSREENIKVRNVVGRYPTRGATREEKETDSDSSLDKKHKTQIKKKSPIKGETDNIYLFEIEVVRKYNNKEGNVNFKSNKKLNYLKIFRFLREEIKKIEAIKMLNKHIAEIKIKRPEEGRDIYNKYVKRNNGDFKIRIPKRSEFRTGIIKEWEYSLDELKEETLPGQNIESFERLRKRKRVDNGYEWVDTQMVLVKFRGTSLPTKIVIMEGHVSLNVTPFVRNIRQCYQCLRFGHTKRFCRETESKCFNCGKTSHGECTNPPKCTNCEGEHSALNRQCPYALLEKAINKLIAYKNMSFHEAKSVAMTELNFRGASNFRYKEEDFPALGQRRTKSRFNMEIEKWEDKPCPIRGNDWFAPNRRQPRSNEGKGRPIPNAPKVSISNNNRFYPLEEEDTQIITPTYYSTKNTNKYNKSDTEEESERYTPKTRTYKSNKTNFGIRDDKDIEELVNWIKEQNLVNVIKNKLKDSPPRHLGEKKYVQGSKGEPTEKDLNDIYEDKQRYFLKNYHKEKQFLQQERETDRIPITYKDERYRRTKSITNEPPIIIKNKEYYQQNKPTTSKHRITPTREDNLHIPDFQSKNKYNYSTLPKTSPRPTHTEEEPALATNTQIGYMSNEEWEGIPNVEVTISPKKKNEEMETDQQQKTLIESMPEENDFTLKKVIPESQEKEEDDYSESFKSPQTETDDELELLNSQPDNK